MLVLWTATPAMGHGIGWILAGIVGGVVFFEYTATFGNAMLPSIAPPSRIGFLSGMGYGIGNLFGVILFVFFLLAWSRNAHPLFGLDAALHEPERAVETPTMLIMQGLTNSVAAAVAGLFAGWLDTKLGSRRSVMVFVAGSLLANFLGCSIAPDRILFLPVAAGGSSGIVFLAAGFLLFVMVEEMPGETGDS